MRLRRRGAGRELVVADQLGDPERADGLVVDTLRRVGATHALRLGGPNLRLGFVPVPGAGPLLTWRAVCDHGPPPLPNWDLSPRRSRTVLSLDPRACERAAALTTSVAWPGNPTSGDRSSFALCAVIEIGSRGDHELRVGGQLHHIGLGRHLHGTAIIMLIYDLDVRVIDATTGGRRSVGHVRSGSSVSRTTSTGRACGGSDVRKFGAVSVQLNGSVSSTSWPDPRRSRMTARSSAAVVRVDQAAGPGGTRTARPAEAGRAAG